MGADNQAQKVLDRIARLELAEQEIERLTAENIALRAENEALRRLEKKSTPAP